MMMDVLIRQAKEVDLPRLGQIAAVSFHAKTRFSWGGDRAKTAAIFQGFFQLGLFSLQHTLVCAIDGVPEGFCVLKFKEQAIPLSKFYALFRRHLGILGGFRAMLILPWLLMEPFDEHDQVLLQFMCVDEHRRNMGLGTRLLQAMYDYGLASGRKEFCSYVIIENPAKNLYHRVGWHLEPPQYILKPLCKLLYQFSGFHRMIWPLKAEAKLETGASA